MESPDLVTNLCQDLRQTRDITCDAIAEPGSEGLRFSRDPNEQIAEEKSCQSPRAGGACNYEDSEDSEAHVTRVVQLPAGIGILVIFLACILQ